jgi:hypothetical protein
MNKKEKLIDEFKFQLYDAQSLWLSDYCCSEKEREQRIKDDEETLNYFINLLEEVINE